MLRDGLRRRRGAAQCPAALIPGAHPDALLDTRLDTLRGALLGALLDALLGSNAVLAVTVTDDTGKAITLPQPARRIVSLAPHVTELIYAAGAGGQLVGAIEYSDYPEAAKKVPRVGSARGIDLERIATLKPDLVIAWQTGNAAVQVERIEALRIPVYRSEPRKVDDVATSLTRIGVLTGHEREAERAAADFRGRVARLAQTYAKKAPVRVFYQVWSNPVITVGGTHLISDVMRLCGAENIFSASTTPAPTVGIESVLAGAPQMIIVGRSPGAPNGDQDMNLWKQWPEMPAVKNKRIVAIDPDLITRHTPRIVTGAEQLCKAVDQARATAPAAKP